MWYKLNNPDQVFSPSLLFYRERIESNIRRMIHIAGDPARLVPHVKTHKTPEIVKMQLAQGITKFKCATLAEAEMVAAAGGKWVLIAYQLIGPNIERLFKLKDKYPETVFSSLIDSESSADLLNHKSEINHTISSIFIDVNNGMNRTGRTTDASILALYRYIKSLQNITIAGLHVYDGHIHTAEFAERKMVTETAYESVYPLIDLMRNDLGGNPVIVVGGSPTFTVHTLREDVLLSPGTNVLWDAGYGEQFDDQPFQYAAVILTRVISKPSSGIVTIDLGHKAVAAENPIQNRFRILNLTNYTVKSQSEEHGVLEVNTDAWEHITIGDVFYAVPFHVCPTVALHDYATVIENGDETGEWKILARSRRITV
jgi:D-serine deaminase-like pyridoxal phosphate-dependent protein